MENVFGGKKPDYGVLSPQCKTKIVCIYEVIAREFGSGPHVGILASNFKKKNSGDYFVPPGHLVCDMTENSKKYS